MKLTESENISETNMAATRGKRATHRNSASHAMSLVNFVFIR